MQSSNAEICSKFRQLRQERGLSQLDVDRAMNWKTYTYGKLERGGRPIAEGRLTQLCAYFGVSRLSLMGYEETRSSYIDARELRKLDTQEAYETFLKSIQLDPAALVQSGYKISFDKCRKGVKGRIVISW